MMIGTPIVHLGFMDKVTALSELRCEVLVESHILSVIAVEKAGKLEALISDTEIERIHSRRILATPDNMEVT